MSRLSLISSVIATPPEHATVLGRVHAIRHHGRLAFVDLHQGGAVLQVAFRSQHVALPEPCPPGAWLEVAGSVSPSRTGTLTLWAEQCTLAQSPTRPLEELPVGRPSPPEQRFLTNPAACTQALQRSSLLRALRQALWAEQFEEVETPILHRSASGAAARPFVTQSWALERELALRVAPEPHLIRLLAAGFPRVFEVARSFRNEGVSARHQPEFTLLEVYEAGATMDQSIAHCTQVITQALVGAGADPAAAPFGAHVLNWTAPRVVNLRALVEEVVGCQTAGECQAWLRTHGHGPAPSPEEAWSEVFNHAVEATLIQPTFVTTWPASISPLPASSGAWATRFELFAGGMELANGFEQNRCEQLQRARFAEQAARVGEEMMQSDEEYLFAMGWGLPPLSGFGIGVDRLVMFATNVSIREAVLFPM